MVAEVWLTIPTTRGGVEKGLMSPRTAGVNEIKMNFQSSLLDVAFDNHLSSLQTVGTFARISVRE